MTQESKPWAELGPAELADHLEASHHTYLRATLPRLGELAVAVESSHRDHHPELERVRQLFEELRADLEPHLLKEEQILFPMVRELMVAVGAGTVTPAFHCGTLANPITVMETEHDRADELLADLSAATDGYTPPADGDTDYRALYEGLAELEADTRLHIHKENDVLFPAVLAAEAGSR